jgi:two-component system, NarL family, response regulator DevR
MSPVRIFVVDDHELLRIGLREAFGGEPDLELIGESDRYEGTASRIIELKPDVAILDVRLGDGSGIELCREVLAESPEVRCIMFTSAIGDQPLHESILAGATGYLLKDASRVELLHAIRTVAAGRSLIDPAMVGHVLARLRAQPDEPAARLTEQERLVLDLMGQGLTNKEVAVRLHLADQTVKNYVSRILTKLDMRRTQAALYAARQRSPSRDQE